MKKLTVKEAIRQHREMWDWLSKHPEKGKRYYMGKFYPNEVILNDCWLCEVNKEKRTLGRWLPTCCILDWEVLGTCYDSKEAYFRLWTRCPPESSQERTRLAGKIRDLKPVEEEL